jgi:hypothetical protein
MQSLSALADAMSIECLRDSLKSEECHTFKLYSSVDKIIACNQTNEFFKGFSD